MKVRNLNKLNCYVLSVVLTMILACKAHRQLTIDNRLNSCLSKDDISLLIKDKQNKKGRKLFITEVQFDFGECIGLFRYEYASIRLSAGTTNYVLKGKDSLFFQSESTEANEKVANKFIETYGNKFSDSEKKYIVSLFSVKGVFRGDVIK